MGYKEDFSFKKLVEEVFNRWTVNKKQGEISVINKGIERNRIDSILCLKATNPVNGQTSYVGIDGNRSNMNLTALIYDNRLSDTHVLFGKICRDVISRKFMFDTDTDEYGNIILIAEYGKQMFNIIESKKDDIIDMCRHTGENQADFYPVDTFGNYMYIDESDNADDWFQRVALQKEYDRKKHAYIDNEFDDDGYFSKEADEGYIEDHSLEEPFLEVVEILSGLIWRALELKACRYTDEFGEINKDDDVYLLNKDPLAFLKKRCNDYDNLMENIENAANDFHGSLDIVKIFKKFSNMIREDCKTVDETFKIMKYWDFEMVKSVGDKILEKEQK